MHVPATTVILINDLTITHCYGSIFIDSVLNTQLNDLFVQNCSNFGLKINNTATVTIDNCSFSHNGVNGLLNLVKTVSISYSNFTYEQQSKYSSTTEPVYSYKYLGVVINSSLSKHSNNALFPVTVARC